MSETEFPAEVVKDATLPNAWRVEKLDSDGDGGVDLAIFDGPNAEARAREYAAWKYGSNGSKIIAGLQDALAHVRGDVTAARVSTVSDPEREKMTKSQVCADRLLGAAGFGPDVFDTEEGHFAGYDPMLSAFLYRKGKMHVAVRPDGRFEWHTDSGRFGGGGKATLDDESIESLARATE
jgi:hypothetical protein